MRDEAQMLHLIVSEAKADDRIRVALLGGSRANPKARRDIFQDYDVCYVVTEMAPYVCNMEWIARFGEIMVMQLPDDTGAASSSIDSGYTYLMQYTDGNRIDLRVAPLERLRHFAADSLTVVLVDKDGLLGHIGPADDSDYLPTPPTARAFADCCNEFWWVCPYVAKGLWRGELPYSRHMLDCVLRAQLSKMLEWLVALSSEGRANPGKHGRHLERYLAPRHYALLQATYADAGRRANWDALAAMCELFRTTALDVARRRGLSYPIDDDRKVSAHLAYVRRLPPDAADMY